MYEGVPCLNLRSEPQAAFSKYTKITLHGLCNSILQHQLKTMARSKSMTINAFDSLLSEAAALTQGASEYDRKQIIDKLRDLAISIEHPQESVQRLMYSQYPLSALRIGCDVNLFPYLAKHERAATVDEIATVTGVQQTLLARLLRYMASIRLIEETGKDTFAANNVTKAFAVQGFQGGVYHNFDYVGPGVHHLPEFLKKHNYRDPTSAANSPLMSAWGTTLHPFMHYPTMPELFKHFNSYMAVQRLGMPTWLDVYPYEEASKLTPSGKPFFVDIGGGFGHQCIALREKLANTQSRIILQDIPATLEHANLNHPGIEIMEQDFYKPQQVLGAAIYYMRNIIHDYPDEQALQILRNTKTALGSESVILIDDMFLEDQGVHWQAAQIDITMMACLASRERTKSQWNDLIAKAGLRIKNVYTYTESLRDSVIECVPAEKNAEMVDICQ